MNTKATLALSLALIIMASVAIRALIVAHHAEQRIVSLTSEMDSVFRLTLAVSCTVHALGRLNGIQVEPMPLSAGCKGGS